MGVARTYTASARIELASDDSLDAAWSELLAETAKWRELRGDGAKSMQIIFQFHDGPKWFQLVKRHIAHQLLLPDSIPDELAGLPLDVMVSGYGGELYFSLVWHAGDPSLGPPS